MGPNVLPVRAAYLTVTWSLKDHFLAPFFLYYIFPISFILHFVTGFPGMGYSGCWNYLQLFMIDK